MTRNKAHKYLGLAGAVSVFSQASSTQVGALIVGPAGDVRGTGYKGAPRGSTADEDNRAQRPEKLFWVEHAERNSIYNAARCGTPTDGCTMIITHPPCMDCARAIVQAGIKEVICNVPNSEFEARWLEHKDRVTFLFDECGVAHSVF